MKNTKCLVVIFALFGALFTISTSASGQAVQWTQAEGGNGNWYEAVDIDSTYQAARSYCEDLGGHLVSLTSADEDTWVYTNLDGGDARWIGAYQDINSPDYSEPDGAWGWVSGEAWSYTNWNGGGPDNGGLTVPDEEVGHYCCGGAWNDLYEVSNGSPVERKFIMEWSADCNGDGMVDYGQILNGELTDDDGNGVPDCCDEGTTCLAAVQWRVEDGGNGNWYEAVDIDSTYQAARSYCEDLGGHLVSLTSADEDTWVYTNLDGGDARWIGAYQDINSPEYSEPNGGWGWVSGEAWSYTNWNGDGPDNNDLSVPDEEAGHYCCGGAWNDLYEVSNGSPVERKFIMEWSADCNGDGMVDYGQILNGELTDNDGNGVPDICQPITVDDDGSADFTTLQAAVDASSDGDTILVLPGTYSGSGGQVVRLNGKNIVITSSEGSGTTIIDGQNTRRGIVVANSETDVTIEGFTVTNCTTGGGGGGVLVGESASPTFRNLIITDNSAGADGAGVNAGGAGTVRFEQCDILNNSAQGGNGGGIASNNSALELINCNVSNNSSWDLAGGICNGPASSLVILNSTLQNNIGGLWPTGGGAGAIAVIGGSSIEMTDCDLLNNESQDGGGGGALYVEGGSTAAVTRSLFKDNVAWSGGALFTTFDSQTDIESCVFDNNQSEFSGQGNAWEHFSSAGSNTMNKSLLLSGQNLWENGTSIVVSNTVFCDVTATGSDGGGNRYQSDCDVYVGDCNNNSTVDYEEILSDENTDANDNWELDFCECPGDIIEDGVVNLVDFSQFLVDFGSTGESISDLNGDLVVDLNDFSIFLVNYGNVCETRSAVAETGVGKVAPTHHIGGVPRRSMN